jgi:hypothetical protein
MELVDECTLTVRLDAAVPVGPGPFGTRRIRPVLGGEVAGARLAGTVLPGGADWLLLGPDGWGRLDVRLTVATHDGAFVYVQYLGVIEYTEAALAANRGERSSDFADHHFRIAPRLESGDARYAWVTRSLFVGEGRLHPGPVVEYRVARVA